MKTRKNEKGGGLTQTIAFEAFQSKSDKAGIGKGGLEFVLGHVLDLVGG